MPVCLWGVGVFGFGNYKFFNFNYLRKTHKRKGRKSIAEPIKLQCFFVLLQLLPFIEQSRHIIFILKCSKKDISIIPECMNKVYFCDNGATYN